MMKSYLEALLLFLICLAPLRSGGAIVESCEPVIIDRGAHHRTWQRTVVEQKTSGRVITNLEAYVELATGMHYRPQTNGEEC